MFPHSIKKLEVMPFTQKSSWNAEERTRSTGERETVAEIVQKHVLAQCAPSFEEVLSCILQRVCLQGRVDADF